MRVSCRRNSRRTEGGIKNMTEASSLLDCMLSKGIHLTLEEFKKAYTENLKERIFKMIESNEDPKVILKNIMDYLEKERVNCLYNARGW